MAARTAMSAARAVAGVVTALYLDTQGFSALEIGILMAIVALANAALSSGFGLASDRTRRRPFLIAASTLAVVGALGFATVRVPALLFALAAIGGLGRGSGAGGGSVGPYQPVESAMLGESVPPRSRTAAFGVIAFCSALGALAGGLLAGLARPGAAMGAAATAAYRPAFLAVAILAGTTAIVALGMREPPHPRDAGRRGTFPRRSWPVLWRFWVTNSVNGLAGGMIGPFISYWLYRRYGAEPAAIGQLFAVVNAASLLSTLMAARVGRMFGTVRAIVAVRVLSGILLVPMALAPTFALAGIVYAVRIVAQRIAMPLRRSYVQGVAHTNERGSVAALAGLPSQGTQAIGQVLAGYMFDEVGLAAPFEIGALLQLFNAGAYFALFRRSPPIEEQLPPAAADLAEVPVGMDAPE